MFGFLSTTANRYIAVKTEEDDKGSIRAYAPTRALIRTIIISTILIVLLLGGGFFAGSITTERRLQPNIKLNPVLKTFEYNRTFGEAPSSATDAAWAELFPEQGGFFKHPTLAPQRAAFSVFHQLHCLDGIRRGYWVAFEAAREGRTINEDELPLMSSPAHIRHCIDLLRNTLMCQPDVTIEFKDDSIGGVRGFGTEHQCKDWHQLVDWTSQWESYQQDPHAKDRAGADH